MHHNPAPMRDFILICDPVAQGAHAVSRRMDACIVTPAGDGAVLPTKVLIMGLAITQGYMILASMIITSPRARTGTHTRSMVKPIRPP